MARLDPPPRPITIAWSERDRILPLEVYRRRVGELFPAANFTTLDDPQLVIQAILKSAAACFPVAAVQSPETKTAIQKSA